MSRKPGSAKSASPRLPNFRERERERERESRGPRRWATEIRSSIYATWWDRMWLYNGVCYTLRGGKEGNCRWGSFAMFLCCVIRENNA